MYCCGTRKSHPRTRIIRQKRGSAEFLTKLFRSEGGISLVPQQYIMMDTFSRPFFDFLRFYMNFVSSAEFFRFFCVCSNLKNKFTNEFSRCRNGCKHSLAPKNGSEIAYQASVLFLLGFETNVGFSIQPRQTVPITCVTLLLHFSDVRNVFYVIQECENCGRTKYCRFDIST